MRSVFVLTTLCTVITAEFSSYEGYKVFELHPANEEEFAIIGSFQANTSLDFWSPPRMLGLPITVMVPPKAQDHFVEELHANGILYSVTIENVESIVTSERTRQRSATKAGKGKISFTAYNRYHEIQDYLASLGENYPNIVSLETIGTTSELRNLSMIKIGTGGSDKPIIFIEGGIHAREWISPAVVTYMIQELVENEDNRNLIENIDWYIIPVTNPDGYEYSHTDKRLWRKTRSRGNLHCTSDGEGYCSGVDGNRNFGFHWNEVGTSPDPCSETYGGPYEFSEPEIAALRDVVLKHKDHIKLFLSIHCCANVIMYPWGYSSTLPDNADELHALGTQVAAAITAVYGTKYKVEQGSLSFRASGVSDDWAKGVGGIELSYTVELPGYSFVIPASRILDICLETFEGLKAYQKYIVRKFVT